jgi:hypothetical protein
VQPLFISANTVPPLANSFVSTACSSLFLPSLRVSVVAGPLLRYRCSFAAFPCLLVRRLRSLPSFAAIIPFPSLVDFPCKLSNFLLQIELICGCCLLCQLSIYVFGCLLLITTRKFTCQISCFFTNGVFSSDITPSHMKKHSNGGLKIRVEQHDKVGTTNFLFIIIF